MFISSCVAVELEHTGVKGSRQRRKKSQFVFRKLQHREEITWQEPAWGSSRCSEPPLKRNCDSQRRYHPPATRRKHCHSPWKQNQNLNSFISHLMGFKAQPLESHKGKSNQRPRRASFECWHGAPTQSCVPSFNR